MVGIRISCINGITCYRYHHALGMAYAAAAVCCYNICEGAGYYVNFLFSPPEEELIAYKKSPMRRGF
jgi:hypothetical protein